MYSITTTGHKADESGNELRTEQGEAQLPKYYSVMDRETLSLLHTARNKQSLADVAERMHSYFNGEIDTLLTDRNVVDEILFYGYEVMGHDEIIHDENK